MKAYPSISTQVDFSLPYWIFDKIDGSNLRAEFSSKRGFYKFGSRTQLLTPDQEALWPAAARIESLEAQVRPVIERMLASTFAGAVALFLVGAFVAIALRKRMETAYRKYLSTIPVPDLARFARGLETDAESRGHAIATLTARQPGWSYQ